MILNFNAYVGHTPLRLYAMGDAAYERAATDDEIALMCQVLRESLEAGAAGLATSFAVTHRGLNGLPIPSRFAEKGEFETLCEVIGEVGKGVVHVAPGDQVGIRRGRHGQRLRGGIQQVQCEVDVRHRLLGCRCGCDESQVPCRGQDVADDRFVGDGDSPGDRAILRALWTVPCAIFRVLELTSKEWEEWLRPEARPNAAADNQGRTTRPGLPGTPRWDCSSL